MIIQCPSCGTRAKLPDSKEGAKVRCGECQRIYVAGLGRRGSSQSSSSNNQGLWIGIGVAGVAGLLFLFFVNSQKSSKTAQAGLQGQADAQEPQQNEPRVDAYSYEGPAARAGRELHRLAQTLNGADLASRLDGPAIYAWKARIAAEEQARSKAKAEELDKDATETAVAAALAELAPQKDLEEEFNALPILERTQRIDAWTEELMRGEAKDLVADWKPYEGEVVDLTEDRAIVHLRLTSLEQGSFENRTIEWELHKRGSRWLAARWERFLTEAEKDQMLRDSMRAGRGPKGYNKVELSDGSIVHEREPEPLEHLADTPQDLRDKIDQLLVTTLDLSLTREAAQARQELVEIGKPAIPALLTKLYEIPLDSEDHSIQVNQVVVALRDITGQYFGYRPMELLGSAVGTTKERRESSIKQWFAWWYRNENKFTERVVEDALDDMIELTEEEKAYLERIKD